MPRNKNLDELRAKAVQETDGIASKRRFGLFSQPPGLAIGDNSYFKPPRNRQNKETGLVVAEPRNVQVAAPLQGKSKSSYMSFCTYKEDVYIDQPKLDNRKNLERMAGIPKDQPIFRDASGWKTICKHPYGHKSDFKGEKNKPEKGQNGKVILEDRNFQTNEKAKELEKFPNTYIKDEYNRQDVLERKRRQQSAKARIGGVFRNMDHGTKEFNKIKKVFGTDVKFKEKQPRKETRNIVQQEQPFRYSNPNKHGWQGTIAKFPKYIENPPKQVKRQPEPVDKKEIFKPNALQDLTRPNSSVSCKYINIRRERMNSNVLRHH